MNSIDPMTAFLIFAIATIVFVALMVTTIFNAYHAADTPRRHWHPHLPHRHA